MAQFEPAFNFLMQHEDQGLTGKVTCDSGGVTRWGISQRAYPDLDIRNLTLEQAAQIYRRDYFTPVHGFDIADQRIASKLFDMAVNMGCKEAVLLLQSALNTHCQPRAALLTEDGKFGPATLAAMNAADTSLLLVGLVEVSREHYRHIAMIRPDEAKDLPDWLRRAEAIPPEVTVGATA